MPLLVFGGSMWPFGWSPEHGWGMLPLARPGRQRFTAQAVALSAGGQRFFIKAWVEELDAEGVAISGCDLGCLAGLVSRLGPVPVSDKFSVSLPDASRRLSGYSLTVSVDGVLSREATVAQYTDNTLPLEILLHIVHPDGRVVVPEVARDGTLVTAAYFSVDGQRALVGHTPVPPPENFGFSREGQLSLIDPDTGTALLTRDDNPGIGSRQPWSQDGSQILVRPEGSAFGVWDLASGRVRTYPEYRANYEEFLRNGRGEPPTILGWEDPQTLVLSNRRGRNTLVLTLMDIATGHRRLLTTISGGEPLDACIATMPPGFWTDAFHPTTPGRVIPTPPSDPPPVDDDTTPGNRAGVTEDGSDADLDGLAEPVVVDHTPGPAWDRFRALFGDGSSPEPVPAGPALSDAWAAGLFADFPPTGDITCDPRTLMPVSDGFTVESLNSYLVTHPDSDVLATALDRATDRMMSVDEDGIEYTDFDDTGDAETPATVFSTQLYPGTYRVALDTRGVCYPWMYRTALHITIDELTTAGLTGAHLHLDDQS